MSYGGVPFPGGGPQYTNPNAQYPAHQAHYGAQVPYGAAPAQYGNLMPPAMQQTAAATPDPYANAKPGTIAYAKSEGPDGIATYTPVIAQETTYNTPTGTMKGIKWVTATSSQASAAGIPSGAITASNPAQLPQTAGMMPPITMAAGGFPPGSAVTVPGLPPGYGGTDSYDTNIPMKPGMTQREYEKSLKRAEKERRASEKAARKEEKERKRALGHDSHRDRDQWEREPQDPYGIAANRTRRMSTGGGLGFERQRRISGGAVLRDDDLSRKLESLDMSFNSRRERRMSGGASGYAPSNAGGFRSRKNSMAEAGGRDRKISGDYGQRPSFYPPAGAGIPGGGVPGGGYGAQGYGAGARSMPGSPARPASAFPATGGHHHYYEDPPRGGPSPRPVYYSRSRHTSPSMPPTNLPGGYGGGQSYGGARDPAPASAYPAYGAERTPHSVASNLPLNPDSYALTRRAPSAAPTNAYPVSGRELNRAQPFTAFEEFFLVEDLRELMQPQPPPLPAALVPHDVMAEEWDRCMQGLISLATSVIQTGHGFGTLLDLVTQWDNTFFLPRGVDIAVYRGDSRLSGPDADDSDDDSTTSSSSSSSSEEDTYYSTRREQRAAKRAERKARHKEKRRRRREQRERERRRRPISIRICAVPLH